MFNDLRVFSGYVWYAYPINRNDVHGLMMVEGEIIRIKNFKGAGQYNNYDPDGVIIVTETADKPLVSLGWQVTPCNLPDGFGGENGGRVVRHVCTTEETENAIYSIFVGLKPTRKV